MILERTETFKKDYKALNAATKMRVHVALTLLDSKDRVVSVMIVDPLMGIEALKVDDFICLTFERIEGGIRLLNVRSIDIGR